jgi:hypothetical protein
MGFNFPASPAVGTLYPASITVGLPQYRWDGEKWKIYAGSTNSAGTFRRFEYNATAGQSTFSGLDINGNLLAYTPGNIELFLNGTLLNVADYTASNGTSVVLPALTLNDQVTIVAFTYGVITDAVLRAGDTMTGTLNGTTFSASNVVGTKALQITNTAAGGANMAFTGDGATTPNKYIRASQGLLEFLNSAYSAVIATLTDAGELSWPGTPWTAYTPSVSITGGTGTATGFYKRIGKTLHLKVSVSCTSGGGTSLSWSLPAGMTFANGIQYIFGREQAVNGFIWSARCDAAGTATGCQRYDNNTTVTSGFNIVFTGSVEIA